jgi:hypothetical protein
MLIWIHGILERIDDLNFLKDGIDERNWVEWDWAKEVAEFFLMRTFELALPCACPDFVNLPLDLGYPLRLD